MRRAEEFEKRNKPAAHDPPSLAGRVHAPRSTVESSGPDYEPGTKGHRRQIVEQAFMGVAGMKRDAAERLYDQQLAEWRAQQRREKRAAKKGGG